MKVMPELLLANAIVPVVLNFRGGVFLVLSIIPIEALVLWLFFNKVLRVNIGIPRVLMLSAIANITSGILGFLFPLWFFLNAIGIGAIASVFVWGFIMSVHMEWEIYKGGWENQTRPRFGLIKAAFLANLVSYTYLFVLVTDPLQLSPNLLFLTRPSYAHQKAWSFSYQVLGLQEKFYQKHSHFAPTFQQLDLEFDIPRQLLAPDRDRVTDKYYEYAMDGKQSQCTLRAFPKEERFNSYIFVIFAVVGEDNEPKLISEICRSDRPSVPPLQTPQLVQDEIRCPPGFTGRRYKVMMNDR